MEKPQLAIDRSASVRRIDLDNTSWIDIVEGFVVDAEAERADLRSTASWGQREVLRYDRYIPEQRLSTGLQPESRPLLRHTTLHLESRYRVAFEGVAAIWYRDGNDFQGLHSDRAMRWLDDTLIAIVVLGQRRPFVIRRRGSWLQSLAERVPAGSDPDDLVLMPGEGTLLVMGGACQRDWMHGIPSCDTPNDRISLTWRWTSRRGRPDTNPGYFDGRQFRDAEHQRGSRFRRPA
jgi:alkylated DNA repair dioxygenase AlkB